MQPRIGQTLWGETGSGQLARLPFLVFTMGLLLLLMALGYAISERVRHYAQQHPTAPDQLTELTAALTGPGVILALLALLLITLTGLNLMSKRLRHMGLPGWPTTVALCLLTIAIGYGWSLPGANGFQLLVWLALVLTPGQWFRHQSSSSANK
ncbi:DUF805 domain-containing protein [Ferrimonas balearica]|uniref:DUF805 domain-containing protein n=1 Tax=Ferrimonas balearica TaxID=44012 RepID=UPI001C5A56CD|nr:hypothetical protein [Ferrimonas balearica]MBW3138741.1 hypothetical protein [Ferrimonas balearica]MBY6105801.1 hypothetical protein [Ferrimonas balearica]MBY6223656.1 hypothetical protein [Ferrimonas balearica]